MLILHLLNLLMLMLIQFELWNCTDANSADAKYTGTNANFATVKYTDAIANSVWIMKMHRR